MSPPGNRSRWGLVAALVALSIGLGGVCVHHDLGWRGATFATFALLALTSIYVLVTRDRLLGALVFLGLVVGFGELPTDTFDVQGSATLVYPAGGPHLWTSPLYMPFAWSLVIVVMGFFAWWLTNRWGLLRATAVLAVVGGVYIPGFEIMAKYAGFWTYRNSPMVLDAAPYYVIAAEAAICASLPWITRGIESRSWPVIFALGVVEAAWIFATTFFFTVLIVWMTV